MASVVVLPPGHSWPRSRVSSLRAFTKSRREAGCDGKKGEEELFLVGSFDEPRVFRVRMKIEGGGGGGGGIGNGISVTFVSRVYRLNLSQGEWIAAISPVA